MWGAIGAIAGSVVSSLWERNNAKDDARKAWERNLYSQDKSFQNDVKMWNMQNEYNTPLAQMERYKEAGLNPNLIYSQGNPGNATSAPSMHMANAEKANQTSMKFDKLMPLFQMKNLNEQNNLIVAQTEAARQDALNKALMNARYGIENEYLPQQLQANIDKTKKETDLLGRNHSPVNRVVNGVLDFGNGMMSGNIFTDTGYRQSEMEYRKGLKNIYGKKWREHYIPSNERYR